MKCTRAKTRGPQPEGQNPEAPQAERAVVALARGQGALGCGPAGSLTPETLGNGVPRPQTRSRVCAWTAAQAEAANTRGKALTHSCWSSSKTSPVSHSTNLWNRIAEGSSAADTHDKIV